MFVDYITLMLVNVAVGFFLLALLVLAGVYDSDDDRWAPAFALTGAVMLVNGLRMTWTWPLPGSYNVSFGEPSVLFGGLLLATAWALLKGWDLKPLGIYGFFAGLVAVVVGIQFLRLRLSNTPVLAGAGFILSGLAGVFSLPSLVLFSRGKNRVLSIGGFCFLSLVSAIWMYIVLSAYWGHISSFAARHS